jgi:hypothetical protein
MERRTDRDPKREEQNREHGRSDRGGPGREQRPMDEQFPGQQGRQPGEAQRHDSQGQPSREGAPRKFGERRDDPTKRRDQGSR